MVAKMQVEIFLKRGKETKDIMKHIRINRHNSNFRTNNTKLIINHY